MHVPSDSRCEWCRNTGLITAYHRDYRGQATVHAEEVDTMGEIRTRRMPGTIAVHCTCGLGSWIRERVKDEERSRIPTLSDVINGRVPYGLERVDADDETELTDAARAYLRRWRARFGGRQAPKGHQSDHAEIHDSLRARALRITAAEAEAEAARRTG